ncbi:outer membrane beta-barrel protein [Helicobacter sp. 11S02596-1]|uniref:outer membrane beta-barrel protein n=1 Tax=Helicobacter sp. 11S02596-1 TaxID=1476194 RepID=UPI000BD28D8E|nr:outer membrane beta-barrel protein [Helicobacter sp. 11S02596-1]PAF42090.1 hypothetical protein BJI48_07195 [Helicobacter sp. 11S02596-1]
MEKIKKSFLGFVCVALLAGGVEGSEVSEKSGVFIGAQVGAAIGYTSISVANLGAFNFTGEAEFVTNMQYGARIGYQQYFNAYNGLRLYGTFDYTNFASEDDFFKYSVNLDYMLNFSDSKNAWGIFAGVGYQWVQSKKLKEFKKGDGAKVIQNGMVINAGLSKIINNHNRFEFGVKVPLYDYLKLNDTDLTAGKITKSTTNNPFDIYLAYSYSF